MSTYDYGLGHVDRDEGNAGYGPDNPDSNPLAAPDLLDSYTDAKSTPAHGDPAPLKRSGQ
jgi:hypothetical protein